MEISTTLVWLVTGLILCGAEMFVGTFFLLVLGVGCLAGAGASWAELDLAWQFALCALVVVVGGVAVRRLRVQKDTRASETLQQLDVGQTVTVKTWQADGTASVTYRGAPWTCVLESGAVRQTGLHRVVRVEGARLVVTPEP